MPGYILHLAESEMILPNLHYNKTEENQFRLGALLPDTMPTAQKMSSHFWNPQKMDQLARAPEVFRFVQKYKDSMRKPVMAGYYAHLLLDAAFVESYWPVMAQFYDEEGRAETKEENIKTVCIQKSGRQISRKEFFSEDYYYGDYSRMNAYIMKKYAVRIPEYDPLPMFPMTEVQPENLANVLGTIHELLKKEEKGSLMVFQMKPLEQLLRSQAQEFLRLNCSL